MPTEAAAAFGALAEVIEGLGKDAAAGLPFSAAVVARGPGDADVEEPRGGGAVLPITAVGPYLVVGPLRRGGGGCCTSCFLHAAFGRDADGLRAELGGQVEADAPGLRRLPALLRAALRSGRGAARPVYLLDTRTGRRSRFRWEHPHPRCPVHAALAAGSASPSALAAALGAPLCIGNANGAIAPTAATSLASATDVSRKIERADAVALPAAIVPASATDPTPSIDAAGVVDLNAEADPASVIDFNLVVDPADPDVDPGSGGERGTMDVDALDWRRSFEDARCGVVRRIARMDAQFADPVSRGGAEVSFWAGWRARPLTGGLEPFAGVDADPERARVKALMEGVERWCLESAAHRRVVKGRWEDVAGAVDPRGFHLYSAEQYASPGFPHRQWTAEREVWWTEGYDPLSGATLHVPLETVASVWPRWAPAPLCQLTSIGTAAHQSYADAALGALLEVIERDAVMRWWYRLAPPRRAWRRPLPDNLAPGALAPGPRSLAVLEIGPTPDISVLLAVVAADDGRPPFLALGAGASVRPFGALGKAAGEAVVNLIGFAALGAAAAPRPYMQPREHGEHYAWCEDALEVIGDLCPAAADAPFPEPDVPPIDPREALAAVLWSLRGRGCAPVLVDLTPPTMQRRGVHVVRAVVPELLPMCFGVGQDRWGAIEERIDPAWRERIRGLVHPFP